MPRILSLFILLVAAMLVQACGNKGALYLPAQSAATPDINQPPAKK